LDALPYPFFAKDAQLAYTACNRAFERFVGKPREQIVGRTVFDVSPPALAQAYHRADLALFERGGTQVYESQVLGADGELRDVVFHKSASLDAESRPTGIVGLIVDLTDRKRAEQALQESERKYRQLVEDALVGTYVIQDGRFVFCNERFARIFGYPDARAVVGEGFRRLVRPRTRRGSPRRSASARPSGKQTSHYAFRGLRRDGAVVEVEVLGSRIAYEGRRRCRAPCSTSPSASAPRTSAAGWRRSCARPRRWRWWASSPAAWPTT
jgi:PAS domain S-box-containing protein